jgi:LuxR family transcriptional regulator, maltose regulon positive regulatory protein
MPILVTRTKVILPRRRADLLSRQRLLDLLFDLMDYKLVIVAAPAGYGKTSLLIDFAHVADLAACWYSLDALDKDPARFIAHFIAAIAHRFPEFGKQSLAALESNIQNKLDLDNLVTTIVNEAYGHIREHFLFVIDDYHLVNDQKEINYFISRFAQEVDENCHLILASRALLTLPDMPLMVAHSMVGGLSFEELAFLPDEIQSLVMQNYQTAIPKSSAEELSLATEGWITGLLLSTQIKQPGFQDRLRIARVSRVRLYDYLAQQVLDQQPAEVRTFLLRTSLLDEFDIRFCETVFGQNNNWWSLFEFVLQNNLFVLPVGEDGRWIRYHHLFREFLQTHLDEENPGESDRIRRRLVAIYTEQEEWEKAHAICEQLRDIQTTANLIVRAGPSLVKNGRLTLIAEWIDQISPEVLNKNPHLMSLRAVPEIVSGHVDQGLTLLNQAIASLRETNDTIGLARALVRRANGLRMTGKYIESLADADEAQQLIGDNPDLKSYYADAARAAGASLYQLGNIKEAIENLDQAMAIYQALEERQNIAAVLMDLGLVAMDSGRYRQALHHFEKALEYWREVNNTIRQANLLNNLGVLYHLVGDYEQAAATFEEALTRARLSRYSRMEAYILSSIGDLYSDLDANKAAIDAYQRSREIARNIDFHFLLLYTDLALAARFRSSGNYDQAQRSLDTLARRITDNNSQFERGLYELETGRLLRAIGRFPSACEWVERAVNHLNAAGQTVETARAQLHLANVYFQAGKIPQALKELNQAIKHTRALDSQHVLVVSGIEAKGLLEKAQNSPDLAEQAGDLLKKVIDFEASIPVLRKRLRPRTATIPFAPPKLTIQALGKSQVVRDGNQVSVPEWQNQRKVRELFFCLLSNAQGLTKEEIGLIFWPESSAAQLKLQFKNVIYRLRHALGPDIVLFDEDLYWFNSDLDYEYDVENFLSCIATARTNDQIEQKVSAYTRALNLYQGPFLPEADGAWISTERERLRSLYVQAALELAQILFETSVYNTALEYCQLALGEEPCLEEAHRLAMQIFAARGNRAGINRQFERCKQALIDEVNALPSPQTLSLYESLIR